MVQVSCVPVKMISSGFGMGDSESDCGWDSLASWYAVTGEPPSFGGWVQVTWNKLGLGLCRRVDGSDFEGRIEGVVNEMMEEYSLIPIEFEADTLK